MKLVCPSCSALLTASDTVLNKLFICPACQSKFVPNATHVAGEDAVPQAKNSGVRKKPGDDQYEMDCAAMNAASEPEYFTWKICPNCGAQWKPGGESCAKCHFNARFDRVVKPAKKPWLNFRIDFQKFYLWIGLGALGYGIYWLVQHWSKISAWIQSFWTTK